MPSACTYSLSATRIEVGALRGSDGYRGRDGRQLLVVRVQRVAVRLGGERRFGMGSGKRHVLGRQPTQDCAARRPRVRSQTAGCRSSSAGHRRWTSTADARADIIWQHLGEWVAGGGGSSTARDRGHRDGRTRDTEPGAASRPACRRAAARPADGDGYVDLVWQHQTMGSLAVWLPAARRSSRRSSSASIASPTRTGNSGGW